MTDLPNRPSGEDALIARYFRPLATDPGAFDLGDDAAALKATGDDVVVTTDAIVEGVHFLPSDPPDSVARYARPMPPGSSRSPRRSARTPPGSVARCSAATPSQRRAR